jgi:mRNA interferase MazF
MDLGTAAKTLPAVIFSVPFRKDERGVCAIVPHTTAPRGGRFEVVADVSPLERDTFDV